MVDAFAEGQEKFELEFGGQIKSLGALQDEVASIRVLQRRLDLQRRAVELYKARLEAVEDRISKQKELEMDWRQRDSRMLHLRCTRYHPFSGGADGCRETESYTGYTIRSGDSVDLGYADAGLLFGG